MAAPDTARPLSASTHGRSIPPPSLASEAAASWLSLGRGWVQAAREAGGGWHGANRNYHIPLNLVVACVTSHRKPPEVRIWRLRNQSCVGTVPPSTSTPHCPACWARRW